NWSSPLVNNPKLGASRDTGLLGFHFALWIKQGNRTLVRFLETDGKVRVPSSIKQAGIPRILYQGALPKVILSYQDPTLPLSIRLTAYSPLIPHDYEAS